MEITLKIENEKQLRNFYRWIFFYRSFFCRFIYFKLKEDNYEISSIIETLNVKGRKKRIAYIHGKACEEIDDFFAGKNVCGFEDGKCLSQRQSNSDKFNGCCRLCEHRTGGACPSRNLACKLFYCSCVTDNYEILTFEDIKVLKCLTPLQRFMIKSDYFTLEKDVVDDLYYGILIATVRVCYRFTKYFFKNRIRQLKVK